jgi:hypothetical protein
VSETIEIEDIVSADTYNAHLTNSYRTNSQIFNNTLGDATPKPEATQGELYKNNRMNADSALR